MTERAHWLNGPGRLAARDLLPRQGSPRDIETKRIEDLNKQIPTESAENRAQLAKELIHFVQDQAEDLQTRTLSAFILTAHSQSFNIIGSCQTMKQLESVFRSEFRGLIRKGWHFPLPRKRFHLSAPRSALLLALLRAMIAVDSKRGCCHLQSVRSSVVDLDLQKALLEFQQSQCSGPSMRGEDDN